MMEEKTMIIIAIIIFLLICIFVIYAIYNPTMTSYCNNVSNSHCFRPISEWRF